MISNRQHLVRIPLRKLDAFFLRAMREVRLPSEAASVCLVTNAEIKKWNRAYRKKDKPTDVLSFPSEESARSSRRSKRAASAGSSAVYLGDIAIAPAVARQNARMYGRTFDQEMRILILHGILHLMGYDHETDTGQMERREKRLRRALGIV